MGTESNTILLVEDEGELIDLYTHWVGEEYDTLTAATATEAIEHLAHTPDCVVLDRRLREQSGDVVLKEINERSLDCPVGMVTSVTPDYDIVDMRIDDYVVKPILEEDLLHLIQRLLSLRSYADEIREYYRLVSKKSALESTFEREELNRKDKWNELLEELERSEGRAAASLDSEDELRNFTK